jgi:cytochrome d ubiquinol oxidase subunit I
MVVSAVFVLGISSYYLLKKQDVEFALRSYALAAGLGVASCICSFFLGDANGIAVAQVEPEKMAAIEGQWETQPAPASWYPIAFPNQAEQKNYGVIIKVPYALSLIATHSLNGVVEGAKPLILANEVKVQEGAQAYQAMLNLRAGTGTAQDLATFNQYSNVIGYGMLLSQYTTNLTAATPAQIQMAATDTIPNVAITFWAFRVMLACWFACFMILLAGLYYSTHGNRNVPKLFLLAGIFAIPLPYIAAEAGWVLTEVGRQPWIIRDILPTFMGSSSLAASSIIWSLIAFSTFYTVLFIVEIFLMFKFGRRGPSVLGTGKYHFEQAAQTGAAS